MLPCMAPKTKTSRRVPKSEDEEEDRSFKPLEDESVEPSEEESVEPSEDEEAHTVTPPRKPKPRATARNQTLMDNNKDIKFDDFFADDAPGHELLQGKPSKRKADAPSKRRIDEEALAGFRPPKESNQSSIGGKKSAGKGKACSYRLSR